VTIGEDRVRIKFNPSDNSLVAQIKTKTAELIDLCQKQKYEDIGDRDPNEIMRLWSLAQTHYEDAAMWATKAATA
jgi:hypothetical protein